MGAAARASRRRSALVGARDPAATGKQRYAAGIVGALLILVASCAMPFGHSAGPQNPTFIAIVATVWSLGDIMTSLLLIAQFYISGRMLFGIVAVGYAFNGWMTWPLILALPGLLYFHARLDAPTAQLPTYIWLLSNYTFPALAILAFVLDGKLENIVSVRRKIWLTAAIAIAPLAGTIAALVGLYALRDFLPRLIVGVAFQPFFHFGLLPCLIGLSALASFLLLRRRPLTQLALWLSLATLAEGLDVLMLEVGADGYSYAWYAANLIAVFTSSNVLLAMLWDIVGMYGRLKEVDRTDPLTSLPARNTFEERLRSLFELARRSRTSLGLLIVAVDSFDAYTATHGGVAGDECLQRIARELLDGAPRPVDFVSRYGSGTFAVLLPDTELVNVRMTAERIRSIVERLQIGRGGEVFGRVTVSIGIAYTIDLRGTSEQAFFDAADLALCEAIARGCNRVMLASLDTRTAEDEPLPLVAVSFGSAAR